ncbi:stage V sporulation protein E [Bacillus cereus]|nr:MULTISPECIES: putative peptidoglycan glycosyltransferase FtsW [Bacillus cereus group]PFJ31053.1 stage V sporulation protein E [Bacillus thuringiensis]PGP11521.1 stage V sporulation protein E [Bacillus cereus]
MKLFGKIKWQKLKLDLELSIVLIALMAIGSSFVFSASSIMAREKYHNMMYFFDRQVVYLVLGTIAMLIISKIRYQSLRGYILLLNIVTILLNLMIVFGISSVSVNGAARWISIFGITFQPSELAKITLIVTLASMIDKRRRMGVLNDIFQGILPIAAYCAMIIGIVFMQKHMSASGVLIFSAACMLIVSGLKKQYIAIAGGAIGVFALLAVLMFPFRMKRMFSFLDPYKDALGSGFHIIQSWRALAGGGLDGLGLGMSRQKFSWLPESHTDFILAIIGEEWGFIGILIIFGLFVWFLLRGIVISLEAPDCFGMIVGTGIVSMFFFQVAINVSVVTGMFPVTGMPLPFVSYGGTSSIMLLGTVGVLLNIASQNKEKNRNIE